MLLLTPARPILAGCKIGPCQFTCEPITWVASANCYRRRISLAKCNISGMAVFAPCLLLGRDDEAFAIGLSIQTSSQIIGEGKNKYRICPMRECMYVQCVCTNIQRRRGREISINVHVWTKHFGTVQATAFVLDQWRQVTSLVPLEHYTRLHAKHAGVGAWEGASY